MKKIEASKLNRSLKEVLDGIAAGERYEITRYGKTVAKLVPPGAREPKQVDPRVEIITSNTTVSADVARREPTPEQLRQKRRDFLLNRINKP